MHAIAAIEEPVAIKTILTHLGLSPHSPPTPPARYDLYSYTQGLPGIGIGGPDVHLMPSKAHLHENAYSQYLKYHDVVPTGPDVQWDNYKRYNEDVRRANTAEELLVGAIEKMNPYYIFWEAREPYFSDDVVPTLNEFGQLPAAKAFYDSMAQE